MRGTLILSILTIRSSYLGEAEEPAAPSDVPDTLQWWVAESGSWRIKTYAIDHDIHTFLVGDENADLVAYAKANNLKHYGDVIRSQNELSFTDCADSVEVDAAFRAIGLDSRLEVSPGRFAFWKPDNEPYHTQSSPE